MISRILKKLETQLLTGNTEPFDICIVFDAKCTPIKETPHKTNKNTFEASTDQVGDTTYDVNTGETIMFHDH
jgi:hypothetical protein